MATTPEHLAGKPGEQTRRALLAKAGVVGGGVGLVALSRADRSAASHTATPPTFPATGDVKVNNVKDWGALGDNSHDDQPYIQECIDASAPGKAAVYIPPGKYRLKNTDSDGGQFALGVPSDSFIFGSGKSTELIADLSGDTFNTVFNGKGGDPQSNIRLEDLVVDCNSNSQGYGIKIPGSSSTPASQIFLRRLEVKNHKFQITEPEPDTADFAVFCEYLKDSAIEDCYVHATWKDGIVVFGEGVVVSGNVVEDCGDDHIVAWGKAAGGISLIGNVVNANTSRFGSGIRLVARAAVTSNVVFGGVRAGIELRGNTADEGPKEVLIANNVILEAGNSDGTAANPGGPGWGPIQGSGISVHLQGLEGEDEGINLVAIADNVIARPRSNGIMFSQNNDTQPIRKVSVSDNVILMDEPDLAEEFDNTSLARRGIALRGAGDSEDPAGPISGIQIHGNQIHNSRGEGIYAKGSQIGRLDIHQNTVADSGTPEAPSVGILIDGIASCSVVGNRAYNEEGGQEYGLQVTDSLGAIVIVGNDFVENGIGPIIYQATSAGPDYLRIHDNPDYNPWAGQAAIAVTGTWTSFVPYTGGPTYYRKDVGVTFGAKFPAGTTPKVLATSRNEGFNVAVVAGANPHISQTLRVWVAASTAPPTNTAVTVNWVAEPVD